MRIINFVAGLEEWNGMANTARQFVNEEKTQGHDSVVTNRLSDIVNGVDVVRTHGGWLPVVWKAVWKAKKVCARIEMRPAGSYSPVYLKYQSPVKKQLVKPIERWCLRQADVILASCDTEKGWISAYEPRVKSINISDLKRFFKLDTPTICPDYNNLAQKSNHILYLGRRHPLKGVEYLEEAVKQLTIHNPQLELKIVSDAFGDELVKVWNWCDILVLPTLSENFGRVVAEALERGKRVITTDGAPAWGPEECGNMEMLQISNSNIQSGSGTWEGYGGRLVYLKGYRDGTPEVRVHLLKSAIDNLSSHP